MQYEILCNDHVCAEVTDGLYEEKDAHLAPLYLARGGDFRAWVEHRALSDNRGLTTRNLKSASGIATNASLFETAMRSHAAMATDHYWVREKGERLSWQDVSFDRYDGFFYELSLGLDSSYEPYRSDRSNPELTNIGNSDKAWRTDADGVRYLYKRQPLYECFQEVAASLTAEALGIPTVLYELTEATAPDPEFGRTGIVRSKDFTWKKNIHLEHADGLLQGSGISERDVLGNAEVFSQFGLAKPYLDLRFFDYLTGNPDRHVYNYGVLRDCKTGDVISLAPNYDNNFAFTAELGADDLIAAAKKYDWRPPVMTREALMGVAEALRSIPDFSGYNIDSVTDRIVKHETVFMEYRI